MERRAVRPWSRTSPRTPTRSPGRKAPIPAISPAWAISSSSMPTTASTDRRCGGLTGRRPVHRLVKEIYPRSHMIGYRGELYFEGFDSTHGRELWKSDGTAAGTRLVKDIFPGSADSYPYANGSEPRDFIKLGGALYFSARRRRPRARAVETDGTAAGTKLARTSIPGRHGSQPDQFAGARRHALLRRAESQGQQGTLEVERQGRGDKDGEGHPTWTRGVAPRRADQRRPPALLPGRPRHPRI